MGANWQNRVVDEGGYLIDTATLLRCEADSLLSLTDETVFAEFFGADEGRAQKAAKLRAIIARLERIADQLDAPQIDESDSQNIGYDAAHSVL